MIDPITLEVARNRLAAIAVVVVIFVLALQGFGLIPVIFFPPNDRPTFTAEIELPTGTPVTRTEDVVRYDGERKALGWEIPPEPSLLSVQRRIQPRRQTVGLGQLGHHNQALGHPDRSAD